MSNIIKRETVKYLVGFLFGFLLWVFILSITPMPETKVYDCSISEFHPDFTPAMRQACRDARMLLKKNRNNV